MAKHNEIGEKGEELAANLLKEKAYELLERNWRYSRAEIDIIAKKEGVLVFVEVKTRTNISFGRPEQFITAKKKKLLVEAASVYMDLVEHDWEIRFDVISVILREGASPEIHHFKDAFFPGL